jgi:hypothetical protein
MNTLEFKILLDEKNSESVRGFESGNPKLKGARIYDSDSNEGVANSIMTLQKEGLVQVPTYILIKGRIISNKESATWQNWLDSHAERDVINTGKSYNLKTFGIKSGAYVVDIQNGGLFVNRPEIILDAVNNRNGYNLKEGAVNITKDMKNTLFGEGMVYSWNAGKIEPVKPDFMGTYDSFLEASANPEFLNFKEKEGRWPIYVVLRPVKDAKQAQTEYNPIDSQFENPDLIIPMGGKAQTAQLLNHAKNDFKWSDFGSWNDGYTSADRGRQVVADSDNLGIDSANYLDLDGGSVGVAPEALRALYGAKIIDPSMLKLEQAEKGILVPHKEGILIYIPGVASVQKQ